MTDRNRIVTLIDMDCFYCQVEEKLDPNLKGKPIAVVQYNEWKGGGIIAVNYLARAKGVTRQMRGDDAREKCPDIHLARVPCVRGKADISKFRDAGKDVAHVLQSFTTLLERASIDEAYLDITEVVNARIHEYRKAKQIASSDLLNNYVLGYTDISKFISDCYSTDNIENELSGFNQEHSLQLLVGGVIVSEIRSAVFKETGFTCSAGIATNKIMAKLVCGMNKPNKQTILPISSVSSLFESLPVTKVKGLGGKFGISVCEQLGITKMKELCQFSEKDLQKNFDEKNGSWLYYISRGIDTDPVTPRFSSKSIGCCKKFAGKGAILDYTTLQHWLNQLGEEIEDRLKIDSVENNRHPTQMVVSFTKQLTNGKDISCSRSLNVVTDEGFCGKILAEKSLQLIKKDSKPFYAADKSQHAQGTQEIILLAHPIKYLGISVGKFEDTNENKKNNIQNFFGPGVSKKNLENEYDLMIKNTELCTDSSEKISTCKRLDEELSEASREVMYQNKIEDKTEYKDGRILVSQESSFIRYFKNVDKLNEAAKSKIFTATDTTEKNESNFALKEKKFSNKPDELQQQESFFLKYFKKIEKIKPSDDISLDNDLKNPVQIEETNLDDPCSSEDSDCTIELEINRSNQLGIQKPNLQYPRTAPKHNLFSRSRSPAESTSSNDLLVLSDKENVSVEKLVMCTQCHKNISEKEMPTHIDYHFALSLREEERLSNNASQIKKPIVSGKAILHKSSKPVTAKHSISSIFNKINDRVNSEIESNVANPCKLCIECGKNIKESAFIEHLDYHEARKLYQEINKRPPNQPSTLNNVKRKRDSKEPAKSLKKKNEYSKPINTFFQ